MTDSQLTQVLNLQVMGTDRMVAAIRQVERSQRRYSESLLRTSANQDRARRSGRKLSDQGLANIQAGLVQLSTYLLNMNVKINNVFDSMQKGFGKTETAMNLLKSTMGLAGEKDAKALETFTQAEASINQLAMTTEYTKAEIAGAFQTMKQDGLSLNDTLGVIGDTLQFATASGGILSLEEAAKITTLTFKTLGGDTKAMGKNLNSLYKVTTDTGLGFDGIREALSGLRIGAQSFAKSELREATINTFIAALMEGGESAANAGLKFKNFGGSILDMYNNLTSLDRKLQETGKLSKRANLKNLAIQRLTGASDLKIGELNKHFKKKYKSVEDALKKNYAGVMQVRNRYAISQLFTRDEKTGKLALKSAEDFGTDLLNKYRDIAKKKNVVAAQATLKQAFGTDAGSQTIKALDLFLKKRGTSLKEYAKGVNQDLGELDKAQADALKTLEKRIKLSESAEDALSEAIFKHDVYARAGLDTYTELVKATGTLMKNNESLASTTSFLGRSLQLLTGVGTNLGFMLTAAATFSIALKHAQTNVAGTTKSLGSTMRAFGKMFLAPTLTVVIQLAGGLFILGVMVVATMKYFSEAETMGEGFRVVLDKIKASAKALGGMFQLMFDKRMSGKRLADFIKENNRLRLSYEDQQIALMQAEQGLGKNSQEYKDAASKLADLNKQLEKQNSLLTISGREGLEALSDKYDMKKTSYALASGLDMLRDIFTGFGRIAEGMIVPVMASLTIVFTLLKGVVGAILIPFKILAFIFTGASDEASLLSHSLRIVGFALGMLISGFLIFKTFTFFTSMITLIGTKFKGMRAAVESTSTSLNKMNVAIKSHDLSAKRQLTLLEKLKLRYQALRGQVDNYNRSVIQSKSASQSFTEQKNKLAGALSSGAGAAMGLAGGLLLIGEGMKNFSDESSWIYGVGDQLSKWGGIILMITPLIQMLTFAMTTLELSFAAAFGWIALIVVGIIALATALKGIYNWWKGKDTKEEAESGKGTNSVQSLGTPFNPKNRLAAATGATGADMFKQPTTTPVIGGNTSNYVSNGGFTTQQTKRVDRYTENQYNIRQFTLNATGNVDTDEVFNSLKQLSPGMSTADTSLKNL